MIKVLHQYFPGRLLVLLATENFLILLIYLVPFLTLGIAVRVWMRRKAKLSEVQAEGDPERERARFMLGIWRRE